MRRLPPQSQTQNPQNQQPVTQSQQFPNPGQFPPEQQGSGVPGQPEQQGAGMPGQRQFTRFPHATQPPQPQLPQQAPPQQAIQPPVQQPPQPVMGQALKPANPPRISYANGEMIVQADNSSMADILSAIARATGAHIEGTQPDSERVFGTFGPSTPRGVLDSLLTGSRYDFILLDAVEAPGKLQRIILSQHGASSPGNVAAANQPRSNPSVEQQEVEEEPPQPVPEPQPAAQPSPPDSLQQQSPGTQQVKTPEQLLQELQRLRQQQQAGQGNPPSPR